MTLSRRRFVGTVATGAVGAGLASVGAPFVHLRRHRLFGYDAMPADQYAALKANYKGSYAFRDKIDIEGIDHPKRMFDVTEGLLRRGYTDDHVRLVLGGNFRRVLGDTWA